MKMFGQYLLEHGLVTKDDLVRALVHQAESIPSLALAMHAFQIYSLDQQLEIFAYQARHGTHYQDACRQLGLWDEKTSHAAVHPYFQARVKPIGEILVELGCLTEAALSETLGRYIASEAPTPFPSAVALPPGESVFHRPGIHAVSSADPYRASAGDKRLFYIYCRSFNDSRFEKMQTLGRALSRTNCEILEKNFQPIRTAATFIGAHHSARLIDSMALAIRGPSPDSAHVLQCLEVLWSLREWIAFGNTEAQMIETGNTRSKIDTLCQNLTRQDKV